MSKLWQVVVYNDSGDITPAITLKWECNAETHKGQMAFQRRLLKKYSRMYPDAYTIEVSVVQPKESV